MTTDNRISQLSNTTDDTPRILGENLRRIRKERGISVQELAQRLNTTKQTIYRYENGQIQKIPAHLIYDICCFLNVSPEKLLEGTSNLTDSETANTMAQYMGETSFSDLSHTFSCADDAREFLKKIVTDKNFAASYGYDSSMLNETTVLALADQFLGFLKVLASKNELHD